MSGFTWRILRFSLRQGQIEEPIVAVPGSASASGVAAYLARASTGCRISHGHSI